MNHNRWYLTKQKKKKKNLQYYVFEYYGYHGYMLSMAIPEIMCESFWRKDDDLLCRPFSDYISLPLLYLQLY